MEEANKGRGREGFLGEGPNWIMSGANKKRGRGFEEGIKKGVETGQREIRGGIGRANKCECLEREG